MLTVEELNLLEALPGWLYRSNAVCVVCQRSEKIKVIAPTGGPIFWGHWECVKEALKEVAA
jgi:hypothetical protein